MWVHIHIWQNKICCSTFCHIIDSNQLWLIFLLSQLEVSPPLFRRSFTDFPWFSTMFLCVDGMCRMEPNRSWGNFGEGVRGSQSFSAPGCSPPTDSWILSSVKLVQPISVVIAASHAPFPCPPPKSQRIWEELENCFSFCGIFWKRKSKQTKSVF